MDGDKAASHAKGRLKRPGWWKRMENHRSAACTVSLEHWETSAAVAVVDEELTRQLLNWKTWIRYSTSVALALVLQSVSSDRR